MKKLLLIILVLASCKKEPINVTYPAGTRFNLKNTSLTSLAQMRDGVSVVPVNPFIIDGIYPTSSDTRLKFYVCHSSNGNEYKMPESNMQIIYTPEY